MTTTTKAGRFPVRVKNATEGRMDVVFCTFDVVDLGGDLIRRGAIKDGTPVVLSAYGHTSWDGAGPLGVGVIKTTDTEAIAELQFAMDSQRAADAFHELKATSEAGVQEWSFSLQGVVGSATKVNGKAVREVTAIELIKEISPVLEGEGVNTRTLTVKARKQLASSLRRLLSHAADERWDYGYVVDYDVDEGYVVYDVWNGAGWETVQVSFTRTDTSVVVGDDETPVHETATFLPKSFSEHAEQVLADLDEFTKRTADVMAMRSAKGRTLGTASTDLVDQIVAAAHLLKQATESDQPANPPADIGDAVANEFARFLFLTSGAPT